MASDQSQLDEHFVLATHKFAVNLYKVLSESNTDNLFFSPISIHLALALTCLGAKGETEEELVSSLHLPKDKSEWLKNIKVLADTLSEHETLKVATELFIEQSYKLKKDYIEAAKAHFKSESRLLDYKSGGAAAESSRNLINNWVLQKTNNKIAELLPAGTVTTDTRLVLVNAIHFKHEWDKQFKAKDTKNETFYLTKNNSKLVPMMHTDGHFAYADKGSYRVLEMPYKGYDFRMLIFLPKEIDGLSDLEKQLPDINIIELRREMHSVKVNITFPKFKLDQYFDLNKILSKLGINAMFSDQKADFSDMYEPGEEPLVVSKVVHKSFLDVNEEGTEAAAATGMIFVGCCSTPVFSKPINFEVDRPFMFYIVKEDVVLFMSTIKTIN